MSKGHFTDQLSAFVNLQLSREDRQTVAEHLMQCDSCRREHDHIKIGSGLASHLARTDAPDAVWRGIESEMNGERSPTLETFANPSRFDLRHLGAFATAVAIVGLLTLFVYRGLFSEGETVAENNDHVSADQKPDEFAAAPVQPIVPTTVANTNADNSKAAQAATTVIDHWPVSTLSGHVPARSLAVGEYLETDAASRVRIDVADIGNVEIAPNSRVKLVGTTKEQHRLSLERGSLHAKIAAPPRLFIVDTPSAMAVDLGCEYTLDVDPQGNSTLKVTGGFVALERGGRESIVPAGAMCLTRKGKGLGTPFSLEATPEFTAALQSFDFGKGGSRAVNEMIALADLYDIVTLWHLLSRVPRSDRPLVYDALARFVPPPEGVTREAALSLDRSALERWRQEVETVWFE